MKTLNEKLSNKHINSILQYLFLGVIAISLILNIIAPTKVSGNSMNPSLKNNQKLWINKLSYNFGKRPKRHDIIVFHPFNQDKNLVYIKRVIGIEGDVVKIKNGDVYINSKLINEPYLKNKLLTEDMNEIQVKKNHVFVLGDNRGNSIDSRFIGTVHIDNIIGKVFKPKGVY